MEIKCMLCLELTKDLVNSIDIYSFKWREKDIGNLIEKHLWPMDTPQSQSAWLCSTCWKALHEFHQFYRRIKDIHSYYEYLAKFDKDIEIEECKVTDILQENLVGTETVWETVTGSDNNDYDILSIHESQNDVQGNSTYFVESRCGNQTSTHVSHRKPQYFSSGSVVEETTEYISQERESDESMSNNSNSKMFKCKYCCKSLKEQRLYLRHIAWHEGNVYICEICDLKFIDKSKLEHHKLKHTTREKIPKHDDKSDNMPAVTMNRSIFSLATKGVDNMESEMELNQEGFNTTSNKGTFECKYCSKVLEDQRLFSCHIAWHEGTVYCCKICDLQFLDLQKFKTHKLAHKRVRTTQFSHEETSKLCIVSYESDIEEAESDTTVSNTLKQSNIKSELQHFECKYCPKVYVYKVAYLNHLAWHEENIFRCDICDLKFCDAAKFNDHKSTHTSKRSRSCDSNGEYDALIEEPQEDVHQDHLNHNESEGVIEDAGDETTNTSSKLNSNSKIEEVKCKFCFQVLEGERVLLNHIAWHEGDLFHCNACELKFFDKSKFEDHQLAHTMSNETPESDGDESIQLEYFVCTICSKVLNNRRLFLNHNAWHVKDIQQCDICDLKFLDKTKFDTHQQTHLTQPSIPCPECGKTFACKYQVRRHRDKMHRNADVKVCDICGKAYRCPMSFKRHVSKHKGVDTVPKLPCDICGRILLGKLSLKSHQLINHPKNGILPYCCDICLKRLATRALLNRHMVIAHSTLGDVKCHVCDKNFKSLYHLKNHSIIHTAAEPTYKCDWCELKYYSSKNMLRHQKKIHPKEYEDWKSKFYVQICATNTSETLN